MTETGTGAPPSAATFESLESRLQAVTQKLEDPAVPLEERLRLHERAVSMHKELEVILNAARAATSKAAGAPVSPSVEPSREPYEAVRDRLAQVVNALESDDLPLARVVELHGEARRLAARCEAILEGARGKIAQPAETTPAAPSGDDRAPPRTPWHDDVPF